MTAPSAHRGTLLVFVKSPVPGRVKTRLAGAIGSEAAALHYRLMGRTVVEMARSGPWRTVVHFTPSGAEETIRRWLGSHGLDFRPQHEGDLGARMHHALVDTFRDPGSTGPICLVGTDTPALGVTRIEEAFHRLEEGVEVVLGPSLDGGYYLVGLREPRPELFAEMRWSTPTVLDETLARARRLGIVPHLLPPLNDIDRVEDLPVGLLGSGEPRAREEGG